MRGFVNDSNLYSEYYVPRLFSLMKNHISKNEKNHTKYLAHCAIDMIKSCHSLQFENAFFYDCFAVERAGTIRNYKRERR